jgi:fumarate hydratase class II
MHIAAYKAVVENDSRCRKLDTLHAKATEFKKSKIGRTHLMDATPLTVGPFWLCGTVKLWFEGGKKHLAHLSEVALGGTAGTGLNTPAGYDVTVAKYIAEFTGHPL